MQVTLIPNISKTKVSISNIIVNLNLQMPEEESFAVLVKIMKDYGMREMFKPSMTELGLCMYQLDTLIEQHMPDLHVHFQVKFPSVAIAMQ